LPPPEVEEEELELLDEDELLEELELLEGHPSVVSG